MVCGKDREPLFLSQATWGLELMPPHQLWGLLWLKSQCVGQATLVKDMDETSSEDSLQALSP